MADETTGPRPAQGLRPNNPPLLEDSYGYLGSTPDGHELIRRVSAFGDALFKDYVARGYPPSVILGAAVAILSGVANQHTLRQISNRRRAERAKEQVEPSASHEGAGDHADGP